MMGLKHGHVVYRGFKLSRVNQTMMGLKLIGIYDDYSLPLQGESDHDGIETGLPIAFKLQTMVG